MAKVPGLVLILLLALAKAHEPGHEVDSFLPRWQPIPEGVAEGAHGLQEEEEFTRVDISCSFMLMGMFLFIMVIFYLVNYPDDDIKRYSWSIINTTISIFTAVLIFSGAEEVLIHFMVNPLLGEFPHGWNQLGRVVTGYVVFLLWFIMAELMIAYFANAVCQSRVRSAGGQWVIQEHLRGDHGTPIDDPSRIRPGERKSIAVVDGVEVFVAVEDLIQASFEQRTKCWSMLHSHMAGFAMISAGGDLQHVTHFRAHWYTCLITVVLNVFFLLLLFRIAASWRRRRAAQLEDSESEEKETVHLWETHAVESEDELFGLSISFLLVQVLRFHITGVLSTKSGAEPGEVFGTREIWICYGEALGFVFATIAVVLLHPNGRLADLARGTFSMSFAWCFLFASRWMFESWPLLQHLNITPRNIEGRLVLSLFLSGFACSMIIVLDKIEDASENTHKKTTHKIVKNIVTGLSILVGFTWEITLDGCTEAVTSLFRTEKRQLVSKLSGSILISLVVLPAWRRYILHTVMTLMRHRKEERVAKKLAQMVHQDREEHSVSDDKLTESSEELDAYLGC